MANEVMRLCDLGDDTPVSIATPDGSIEMSVSTVLRWINVDAPKADALRFLMVCRAARVNPFLGEADLVPMGDKWVTVIGKTGVLKKAEERPEYDGFEAGVIGQLANGEIHETVGAFLPDGIRLLGGWCRVYRKDRSRPTEVRVNVREFVRPGPQWQRAACTMIRKVAIVNAHRESGLMSGGWYDPAEVASEPEPAHVAMVETTSFGDRQRQFAPASPAHVPLLTEFIHERLTRAIAGVNMQPAQVATMLARRGAGEIADLTERDALEIIAKLEASRETSRAGEILLPDPKPVMPAAQERGELAADGFPWETPADVKSQAEAVEAEVVSE